LESFWEVKEKKRKGFKRAVAVTVITDKTIKEFGRGGAERKCEITPAREVQHGGKEMENADDADI